MTAPSLGAGSAGDVERLTHEERGWLRVTRFGNFVHLETAVERILAAHVARASPADRERVARVEALHHADSTAHGLRCAHDGMTWPCPTSAALTTPPVEPSP